MIHLGKAEFNS